MHIFQSFFYQPILNLLVFLYNNVGDLGLSIILLTVVVKSALLPLSKKSIKSQKALQDLQPKIDELKKKHKGNQQALSIELMALYKSNKVNPFSSCLPLLIQLPFFIAIFRVLRAFGDNFVQNHGDLLYSFIKTPETINTLFLGFDSFDLAKKSIVLAILAGLAQFWQAKMMSTKKPLVKTAGSKDESMAVIMNKQMMYMMPVMTVFIGMSLPAGLTFYWLLTTLYTAIQQKIIFKRKDNDNIPEVKVLN